LLKILEILRILAILAKVVLKGLILKRLTVETLISLSKIIKLVYKIYKNITASSWWSFHWKRHFSGLIDQFWGLMLVG